CPSSPVFKDFGSKLVEKIAARYKDNNNITVWHISNEYSGTCYCDLCEKNFRVWLKDKYKTIDAVNKAWNTEFWSHTFYEWDEIVTPNALGDGIAFNGKSAFSGISVDYDRFFSDALLDNYKMERDIIKNHLPDALCTTNFMGKYKPLDYFKWAKELDIISWDSYPSYNTPLYETASNHALMRSLKNNEPWMLMEQTPSQQNWQPYNSLKKPGQMRSLSYQAVAQGSDTVQFFQLRRSVGASEKFHGAVIDHVGHEHTRVFKEVAQLGNELKKIGDEILHSQVKSDVAILFDWNAWWALEYAIGPSTRLDYNEQISKFFEVFYDKNISVDFVTRGQKLDDYKLVIAPTLYMVEKEDVKIIEDFVENGGQFITTYMSGIVNESDNVHLGGYPGPLKDLLGIWVEEFDALAPEQRNHIDFNNTEYACGLMCDILHLEGAQALATYKDDFYKGHPALTVNKVGKGNAYYVASSFETDLLEALLKPIFRKD
ncbi:MAG TPA: beta-galactosidase, partial [Erysipelothrix sp.]|nr:beta-galactosidase [Erysipelothrix sp.]